MKVYDYIIVCKRRGFKLVDGISQLMLFLALLVFSSSLSNTVVPTTGQIIQIVVINGSIIGWWIYCYVGQKKGNAPFFRLALLVAATGWLLQPGWRMVSAIYFLAAVLEKQVKFPQEIAFDEEEIVINSLPKKYFHWNELTNVVIKDGILTIDFKNNKLIQKEMETHTSAQVEQEFNDFCRNKLDAKSLTLNAKS